MAHHLRQLDSPNNDASYNAEAKQNYENFCQRLVVLHRVQNLC
ncbi:hypothetical protein PC119_g11330 [Phytophthora cactorum]|nr:hypothetical protein PC114_g11287 [Phytophthora cactorum]KAG3016546.1 hypothetical protein PC119_g11330 [Phytophthora cactorum]KAG3182573.1 hypothetical protein C6341_g5900 [Phytophthora cactorum]KAG4055381.1 hypothetical protein PC123_g9529 [Phytophthora cactorum]